MNYLAKRFQPSKLESTVGQQQLQWHTKPSRKFKKAQGQTRYFG